MAPSARAAAIGLALCLLLGPPGSVAGAEPRPTPSAQELLDEYPLHATPDPGTDASPAPRATATRRVSSAAGSDDGGGSFVPPLLAMIVLVTGAAALLWTFRPSRGDRAAATAAPDPKPAAKPLAAVPSVITLDPEPAAAVPAAAKVMARLAAAESVKSKRTAAKPAAAGPAPQPAAPDTAAPPPAAPEAAADAEPAAAKRATPKPAATEPAESEPAASKPAARKRAATQRDAAKPAAAKPAARKRAAQPVAEPEPAAPAPPATQQQDVAKPTASGPQRAATQPRDAAASAAPQPTARARGHAKRPARQATAPASQQPAATPSRDADPQLLSPAGAPARIAPPDLRRGWVAEIQWVESASGACFVVRARTGADHKGVVLAESSALEWPPAGPATVDALTAAVEELERALLAAGWTALPAGSEWYAKRFAWQAGVAAEPPPPTIVAPARTAAPASTPSPAHASRRAPAPRPAPALRQAPAPRRAPAPARVPAHEQQRPGRFLRRAAWPEGSEQLWRCELRWQAGVRNSRFEAVAYEPGTRSGRPVAAGATFKWLMKADPDSAGEEYRSAVRALAVALQADGWERAGHGAKWYSARFLWRRPGTPPDHLEPAAPRTGLAL